MCSEQKTLGWKMSYKNLKIRLGSTLTGSLVILGCLALPNIAQAQSTPTELADLALEDLLNFDVVEDRPDEDDKSKWSFSYTYRKLSSGKYRSGTTELSFQDVLFSPGETRTAQNFPVVPTYICQEVHALSAGYAISDKITANVVIPYIEQGTDHISSVPGFPEFLLRSKGIGDISLSASYLKRLENKDALQFNIGIRVPTGSINKTGDTPRGGAGTLERLPYTMQIGSGTLDFSASANYTKQVEDLRLSASASTTIRTGKNDNDYRLGNNYGATLSAQYVKHQVFQPGARLIVREIDRINGRDESLLIPGPFPFPAGITNPDNYGGTKVKLAAIIKICPEKDCKVSFTGEYGVPLHQNLNGVQPQDRSYGSFSANLTF